MRARLAVLLAGALFGLVLSACGGDGGESSPTFSRADLPRLVLKPTEGPAGLRYSAARSGHGSFELRGKGETQLRERLRQLGLLADRRSVFVAASHAAPVALADSGVLLFRDAKGAHEALTELKESVTGQGTELEVIGSKGLGEDSWAYSGRFFGDEANALVYGWRRGNALLLFSIAGQANALEENTALAAAVRVDSRAAQS